MCQMVIAILFMVPLGIQEATGALIGNAIGANNVPLARRFFSLTFKFTATLVVLMAVLTILLRHPIAKIFTTDE